MTFTLQTAKKTTLSADIASGDTSATLSSAVFTNFTSDYLVIDYDIPAKLEVVLCNVTGTAVASMTRGTNGTSAVAHTAGAKIMYGFVPKHYEATIPGTKSASGGTGGDFTTVSTTFVDVTSGSTTYTNTTGQTQTVLVTATVPIANDTAAQPTFVSLTATGTGVSVTTTGYARATSTTFVTVPLVALLTVTAGNTATIKLQARCSAGTARIGTSGTETTWKITAVAVQS